MGGLNFDDLQQSKEPEKYNKWVAYGTSKGSNALFVKELQKGYGDKGITAFAVHPGGIMTELGLKHKKPFFKHE